MTQQQSQVSHEVDTHIQDNRTINHVLGIPVDVLSRTEFQKRVTGMIRSGRKGWLSYVNIHTIQFARATPWFKQFIEDAAIAYCDGEGVRLAAFLSGDPLPVRITLTQYIFEVAALCEREGWKMYFLGGEPGVVQKAAAVLESRYSHLPKIGYHHGYFAESESDAVIKDINAFRPDILLFGMGVPKQERWARDHVEQLDATLLWMGGGFLDTLSGKRMTCPRWLGSLGFEWLVRLVQEPKRLWRRYLIGNPLFFFQVLHERFERL